MQKNIILIALISLIFITSCTKDKWFDHKQNTNQVVPSSVTDFQALLDNIIMDWNSPYLAEIASDEHYITDVLFNSLNNNEKNAYTWSHSQPYQSVVDWGISSDGTYTRVYYANLVLDGLKTASDPGNPEFDDVKGEALFYRAKNFYDASQVYSPAYDSATAATDLGIPLRLESDINIPSARSTVKQAYNQIINDLLQAKDLLPVTPLYKTRPSKPACFALLARVYLSARDYTDAGRYADSCLKLYSTLVDYNTLVYTATYPLPIYNVQVIFNCSMNVGNGPNTYNARIDPVLYSLYDSNDLRKKVMFTVNTDGSVSFKNGNYYNTVFTGMSVEEMYIVRAECSARAGQINAAMSDINTLLKYRYKNGTYIDKTAASASEALSIVLTERRKELLLHGLRWSDLRRFNKDPNTQVTLTRTVAGKTYILAPNSYNYTFPIPDDVISLAPQLQQNPGW